jgi:hypothetical protein
MGDTKISALGGIHMKTTQGEGEEAGTSAARTYSGEEVQAICEDLQRNFKIAEQHAYDEGYEDGGYQWS